MPAREPERTRIAGAIPALIWRGDGAGVRPAIVSIHGGGGSKDDIEPEIVDYVTSRGVTLVTIDAHLHGERRRSAGEAWSSDPFDEVGFLEIIEQTARELFAVFAYLRDDGAIDADRIGVRGGSMGGYIALAATGLGVQACAVLSICGGADYVNSFGPNLSASGTIEAAQMEELERRARAIDPLFHADRFPPRPVFLIHGVRDPLVPIAGARALYDALTPYYQERPQDLLFLSHAGEHGTPEGIERMGWDWLIERTYEPDQAASNTLTAGAAMDETRRRNP